MYMYTSSMTVMMAVDENRNVRYIYLVHINAEHPVPILYYPISYRSLPFRDLGDTVNGIRGFSIGVLWRMGLWGKDTKGSVAFDPSCGEWKMFLMRIGVGLLSIDHLALGDLFLFVLGALWFRTLVPSPTLPSTSPGNFCGLLSPAALILRLQSTYRTVIPKSPVAAEDAGPEFDLLKSLKQFSGEHRASHLIRFTLNKDIDDAASNVPGTRPRILGPRRSESSSAFVCLSPLPVTIRTRGSAPGLNPSDPHADHKKDGHQHSKPCLL
jgi:hypothetical protein